MNTENLLLAASAILAIAAIVFTFFNPFPNIGDAIIENANSLNIEQSIKEIEEQEGNFRDVLKVFE